MMGATFGSKADSGTIRGDFGVSNSFNLIHGSDSPEAAQRSSACSSTTARCSSMRPINKWVYDYAGGNPGKPLPQCDSRSPPTRWAFHGRRSEDQAGTGTRLL